MAGEEDRPPAPRTDGEPPATQVGVALPVEERTLEAATDQPEPSEHPAAWTPEPSGATPSSPQTPGGPAERPRSFLPLLLSLIGGVLIVLLGINLYAVYNPPGNDAVPALQAEVSRLRQQVDGLSKQVPDQLAPLNDRLSSLDDRVAGLKAAVDQNAGGAAAAAEAKAAMQPLAAKVDDLHGALEALAGRVAGLPKVDLAPLTAKVDGIEKRLPPLESYFAAPKTGEQVTEARQNGSAAETRAAPVAVITGGILNALQDGRPFEPEVKALAGLGVDKAALAPLETVAAKGAPTDAALASTFASVQDAAVVAAAPVSTGTMLDRMMANAQSLVRVSRTGAGPGEDAGAGASRIAAALKAGDLPAAEAEWEKLPEASRTRTADWAATLKSRIAADNAARTLQRSAVDALAASVPAP